MRAVKILVKFAMLAGAALGAWAVAQPPSGARAPQNASVRLLYTPSREAIDADGGLFGLAQHTIDLAGYVLTDKQVMESLEAAARRGVKIRLYLDRSFTTRGNAKSEEGLKALAQSEGVAVRFKAREAGMMHLKSYAVDQRYLRTGSANFSYSGGRYQDNDILILDSPPHAAQFESQFETMWARADNEPFTP